jgi:hypothetical protein
MSEKLSTKDFRRGNLFLYENCFYIAETIRDNFIYGVNKNGFAPGEFPIELIKPIPLTSEIFLSCGFEKSKFGASPCEFMYNEYKIGIDTVGNCFIVSWGNVPINEVKYLNHLQNIFYFLTNKELEFKPEFK